MNTKLQTTTYRLRILDFTGTSVYQLKHNKRQMATSVWRVWTVTSNSKFFENLFFLLYYSIYGNAGTRVLERVVQTSVHNSVGKLREDTTTTWEWWINTKQWYENGTLFSDVTDGM